MKIVVLSISCLFALSGQSQNLLFPNNNSALLLMNPSFAGTSGGTRIQSSASVRNVAESFRFYVMQTAGDTYIEKLKAGVGLALTNNSSSFFSENTVDLTWAQHFELSKNRVKIIPALTLGYRRNSLDVSVFSGTSPAPISQNLVSNQAVIGASVLLELYERLYVGVVVRDVNVINDFVNKPNLIGGIGTSFNVSYNLQVSKNDLLQAVIRTRRFNGFQQTQIGANFLHKKLLIGAGISVFDAAYFQLGYKSGLLSVSAQSELVVSRLAGRVPPMFGINLAATIRGTNCKPAWKSVETW